MEKTTTQLTNEYIKAHPNIKSCLKKGLINYSSLSRLIAKDLAIEKKTSKEAILIAARRFKEALKKEIANEKDILSLLNKSELEVRNKIAVIILSKDTSYEKIDEALLQIRKEHGTLFLMEGSSSFTLITQEKYLLFIETKLKNQIQKKNVNLSLIILKSSKEIESTVGVVAYLTALFSENEVNIIEFLSSWTDTIFVIENNDVTKTMNFLKF